jgi:hypothetical protein
MMRRALAVLLVLAGCLDESPATSGGEGVSKVLESESLHAWGPEPIDILFVLDNTPAIAPYLDRMATLPSVVEAAYKHIGGGLFDAHIAVMTSSGAVRTAPGIADSYIAMYPEFDLTWTTNYEGAFVDRLRPLMTFDATDAAPNGPLAAIESAAQIPGFRRQNMPLGIVIVSGSDDASPDDPAAYYQRLKTSVADPASIYLTRITTGPTPRLDAFTSSFPNRNKVVSIADADYAPAITAFELLIRTIIPGRCWDLPDVDPETPGIQYDCSFSVTIRGSEHVLPPCRLPGDQFCWMFVPSERECSRPGTVKPEMPPYQFWSFVPQYRAQCVVLDMP